MRIEFNKNIEGYDNLEGFLTAEPEKYHHNSFQDGYFIKFEDNLDKLKKYLVDGLEQEFKKTFTTTRTAYNTLWIAGNNPFSLRLDADKNSSWKLEQKADRWDLIGNHTRKKRFSKTIQIPIFREIPEANVKGKICFERLDGIDPNPILGILINNNYESEVIPTSQELEDAIKRSKKSSKSSVRSYSSGSSNNTSGGSNMGSAVGGAIGGIPGAIVGSFFDD